jgi:hypothetical protein
VSFILIDRGDCNHDLQINGWHWRTVLELLRIHNSLPESTIERMGIGGIGTTLEKSELNSVSAVLRKIIPDLSPDEWILPDGAVTNNPEDPKLLSGLQNDAAYRTNRLVLEEICEFCDTAAGVLIC